MLDIIMSTIGFCLVIVGAMIMVAGFAGAIFAIITGEYFYLFSIALIFMGSFLAQIAFEF